MAKMSRYQKQKSALTRAINKKNPMLVLAEVSMFRDYYRQSGEPYPDDWSRWQRAADDAVWELRRQGKFAQEIRI